ncbi:MAG: TetR/AcrR family transcriptional regulator [Acidobacteria bacterium]|nr:TetR/AcrR family transcriptional regulator [Acidobacteriota bacterium]
MSSKNSDTREKIIESAAKLLLKTSGQGVRMADIAKAAGVSRQAVYLHFPSRGELMIAAVRLLDDTHDLNERLKDFREARTGVEILESFVEFWGNYIPMIYGVAKALLAARDTDEAVAAAWDDRMNSIRDGCRRTIETIEHEGLLSSEWNVEEAVDLMWTMLSIQNWERLTIDCGWTVDNYVERMKSFLKKGLLR